MAEKTKRIIIETHCAICGKWKKVTEFGEFKVPICEDCIKGIGGEKIMVKCDYCGKSRPRLWMPDGKFCNSDCHIAWLNKKVAELKKCPDCTLPILANEEFCRFCNHRLKKAKTEVQG